MCGICGELILNNKDARVDPHVLVKMRDTMSHRGPDGFGLWISEDGKVGFGHRRLSIIDLSPAAAQPMCNEDKTIWITYNGEIYNHLKIRKELESHNHIYKSHSDTETLIHAYEQWGIDFIHRLEGMFAFALWDSRNKSLYLVRDRIGVKPLYWCEINGKLLFASEIKAILAHPDVHKDVNLEGLYHYLTFSVAPAPLTLFKDIYKISAGHYVKYTLGSKPRDFQYWDAIFPQSGSTAIYWEGKNLPQTGSSQYLDEDYCISNIRKLFNESVEKRMMSDVPFGVFLSGGVDSSSNVAVMSRLMNQPVRTFSIGIKGQDSYNEFLYARKIAKLFGTDHHEVEIDDDDFLNFFEDMPSYQDEPLSDPVCVPLYYVSKLARRNNTIVMQVGEGSDEIFSGYDEYVRLYNFYKNRWSTFMHLSPRLRLLAYDLCGPFLDPTKRDVLYRAAVNHELFWGGSIAFSEREKSKLLAFNHDKSWHSYDIVKPYYDRIRNSRMSENNAIKPDGGKEKSSEVDYLTQMIYIELKIRLPELLLMRVDKMGMANSIEARVPFLDPKLVEFALNIPPGLKIKNNTGKYIFKRAALDVLPSEVIDRKKMGFCGSSANMLTPNIFNKVKDDIARNLTKSGLFNQNAINENLKQFKSKPDIMSYRVWNLLNLSLWLKYYF